MHPMSSLIIQMENKIFNIASQTAYTGNCGIFQFVLGTGSLRNGILVTKRELLVTLLVIVPKQSFANFCNYIG